MKLLDYLTQTEQKKELKKASFCYINRSAMGGKKEKQVEAFAKFSGCKNLKFVTHDGVYLREDVKHIIELKNCKNIILFSVDRMGRDSKSCYEFLKFAKKKKVNVHIMDGNLSFYHKISLPKFSVSFFDVLQKMKQKEIDYIAEITKAQLKKFGNGE